MQRKSTPVDAAFFQRWRTPDSMSGYLTAKLTHEDAIRSSTWDQGALFAVIVLACIGSLWSALSDVLTFQRLPHWFIAGLAVVGLLVGCWTVLTLIVTFRPTFQVVLPTAEEIRATWDKHVSVIASDDTIQLSLLPQGERSLLNLYLAEACGTLHSENRHRRKLVRRAQSQTVALVGLTVLCYAILFGSQFLEAKGVANVESESRQSSTPNDTSIESKSGTISSTADQSERADSSLERSDQ